MQSIDRYYQDYKEGQYEDYNNGKFVYGEQINARYIRQTEPTFQNNLLIEALPPTKSFEKTYRDLYRPPLYSDEERNRDKDYRFQAIYRLQDYVKPMTNNIEVEKILGTVIRQGYVSKNIASPEFIAKLKMSSSCLVDDAKRDKLKETVCVCRNDANQSAGCLIMGISGGGKSTAVKSTLPYYPQIIRHLGVGKNKFLFTQISWLKIDCSYNGSIKGVCQKFFGAIDKLLGTDYLRKHGQQRAGIDSMIAAVSHLALKYALGVLVIDEIQHINKTRGEESLNFFVSLMNEISLPIVYIGTYKVCKTLFGKDFRHARRAMGLLDIDWGFIPNDDEWELFINDLWKYQWVTNKTVLTQSIKDLFYEETFGITDRVIKLFMACQAEAITSDAETITEDIIKRVAKAHFSLTKDMIQALKNDQFDDYDDMKSPNIKEIMQNYKATIETKKKIEDYLESEEHKSSLRRYELRSNVIVYLSKFVDDYKKLEKCVDAVIKEQGTKQGEKFILDKVAKILYQQETSSEKANPPKAESKKIRKGKLSQEDVNNFKNSNCKNIYETVRADEGAL